MRKDMVRVVTEKTKSRKDNRRSKYMSYDVKREKINHAHDGFAWDSGPLIKFLHSRVGQNWDDVYREIREVFTGKDYVSNEVLKYIPHYVSLNTKMEDGKVVQSNGLKLHSWSRDQFYIHPETNMLCCTDRIPNKPRKIEKPIYLDGKLCKNIDGIWYLFTVKKTTEVRPTIDYPIQIYLFQSRVTKWYDSIQKSCLDSRELISIYGDSVVGIAKKSANHKEVKKIKEIQNERQL